MNLQMRYVKAWQYIHGGVPYTMVISPTLKIYLTKEGGSHPQVSKHMLVVNNNNNLAKHNIVLFKIYLTPGQ